MKFSEALEILDNGGKVYLPYVVDRYLVKQHNLITKMPENVSYRPCVTALNSPNWKQAHD